MCLERMLDAVAIYPARLVRKEELTSLNMGDTADVTVFKLAEKGICYRDREEHTFTGHQVITP